MKENLYERHHLISNSREITNSDARKIADSPEQFISYMCYVDIALAKKMKEAVQGFTSTWDYEIRQVQMGNKDFTSKYSHNLYDIIEKSEMLEAYIAAAPKWNGMIYRGISVSLNECIEFKRKEGEIIDMKGTSSWSTHEDVALDFAEMGRLKNENNSYMIIFKCNGTHNGTSIQYLSSYPAEHEVICSKLSKYKVIGVSERGNYTYLDLEIV